MTTAKELFEFINFLSKYVDKEFKIFTFGGSALTIMGLREDNVDIDINLMSVEDDKYLSKIFESLNYERVSGIRWKTTDNINIDLFVEGYILGVQLPHDYSNISKHVKTFGKIKLYTLSPYDLIISKLARSSETDFEDIKALIEKYNIDPSILFKRYEKTCENSKISTPKEKMLHLFEEKYPLWKKKVKVTLINKIKKWNTSL